MTNMRIEDNQTYEFGMLSNDAKKMGNHTEPTFSVNRYHAWPGMSLSWLGKRFRQEDRRRIRTFNDYLTINPDGYPTGRTFFFYKITVDGEERKRELVHEGMFSDPAYGPASAPRQGRRAMGGPQLSDKTASDERSTNGQTVAAMQAQIIENLTRENNRLASDNSALKSEIEEARRQAAQSQERMLSIEAERIRYQVEKESVEERHKTDLERLASDHQRDLERLKEDHARELEAAREEEAASTMQALSDEMDTTKMKIQNGAAELLSNLPTYLEFGKGLMDMFKNGFGSKPAESTQLPAQKAATPINANNFPSPYDQRLSPQYDTADHAEVSQHGNGE